MKSVMTHQFSRVPSAQIPRSSFDRSHGHKTTFDAGLLIPIFVDEALPGDTFQVNMSAFARLATPIFPLMDNMYMDTQFFSVPVRLVWDNWQKFNGEQRNPGDSTDFLVPQIVSPAGTGYATGSLSDYFGIPTGIPGFSHSSLWHRAYNLIWNEWYRDENMQQSIPVDVDDGPDDPADYVLRRRGKRHDYFTSCLPWPQKGPGVQIPLGTSAPVTQRFDGTTPPWSLGSVVGTPLPSKTSIGTDGSGALMAQSGNVLSSMIIPPGTLTADLSQATAATINSLRQAFQIQKIYERDARGGTRYTEMIRSHFGVTSPDARLQRPEYLGGGSSKINITPVPQTSASGAYAESPQGNLAGFGTGGFTGHGFSASFTEHCLLIGIVSVRADLNYQQGLNRMFSRRTRFDFYLPALSHIGEQAVLQSEIWTSSDNTPAGNGKVFGYQERFAEYRYKPSIISGLFKSNVNGTLDPWHLAQWFVTPPVLGDAFIQENPPIDRCIAVPTEPHFLFDSYFSMRCTRPMPVYGVPGLIDHF